MTQDPERIRRAAALLAELLVKGVLDRVEPIAYTVYPGKLQLLIDDPHVARSIAARLIPDATYRNPAAYPNQHTWAGTVGEVGLDVSGIGVLDLDPLNAVDEDDYLNRLIGLGLVVE